MQAVSKAVTGSFFGRLMVDLVMPTKRKEFEDDIEKFKRHLEEDAAARDPAPEGIAPTPEMVSATAAESLYESADATPHEDR